MDEEQKISPKKSFNVSVHCKIMGQLELDNCKIGNLELTKMTSINAHYIE